MQKILITLAAGFALLLGVYLNLSHNDTATPAYVLDGYQFNTVNGTPLDLGALKGQVTVLNFWATWCPPCVEEMPELEELYHSELKPSGIEMIGVAIDREAAVTEFLQKTPVSYPVVIGGLGGTELGKTLGNNSGGLPYTVILNADGEVLLTKAGRIQMQTIRDALPR